MYSVHTESTPVNPGPLVYYRPLVLSYVLDLRVVYECELVLHVNVQYILNTVYSILRFIRTRLD